MGRLHDRILTEWLSGYKVHNQIILPQVVMLEMMLASTIQVRQPNESPECLVVCNGFQALKKVVVQNEAGKPTTSPRILQCCYTKADCIEIFCPDNSTENELYSRAQVLVTSKTQLLDWYGTSKCVVGLAERCIEELDMSPVYDAMEQAGFSLGSAFKIIEKVLRSSDGTTCTTTIKLSDLGDMKSKYLIGNLHSYLLTIQLITVDNAIHHFQYFRPCRT